MRIHFTTVATSALILQIVVTASPVTAQPAPPPGTLVRVMAPTVSPVPVTGTIVDSSERELVVFQTEAGKRTIPIDAISKLEWSSGRHSKAGSFAKWGALAGAGLGVITLTQPNIGCESKVRCGAAGALWGGVSGGMYGAFIGLFIRTYDWKEVSVGGRGPRSIGVLPMVSAQSKGIAARLSF